MKTHATVLFSVFALSCLLAACQTMQPLASTASAAHTIHTIHSNTQHPSTELINYAKSIQHKLAIKDYAALVYDIHPTQGVRFSMYAYVQPEQDKVFTRSDFAKYLEQNRIRFTWGAQDGSGDLLVMALPEYLDTWVTASDFDKPNTTISVNDFQVVGNSLNNLSDVYQISEHSSPQSNNFVEFYYKGSTAYDGMDWRALRLVFESYQGKPYLVAIVTDEWTI